MALKHTPFYAAHLKAGGQMIDFGGWELPVQYSGIIKEHMAVRTGAAIFDVSHMGEISVTGKGAKQSLQQIVVGNIEKLIPGRIMYSMMCQEDGGTIDDILIYMMNEENYFIVVNASNVEKDFAWISAHMEDADAINESDAYAQIAIQGPKAIDILSKVVPAVKTLKQYHFIQNASMKGFNALISRTGYTGEDGAEIYLKVQDAEKVWELLMSMGEEEGLIPCGLGARDTLRFEAAMPLYGHELSATISPLAAGLSYFVHLDKPDFIGKDALVRQKNEGIKKVRVGLEMMDRGIAREGYAVFYEGENVGHITSGMYAPFLKQNLAMAMVDATLSIIGQELHVMVREKLLLAKVVALPFYKREKKS